MSNQVAISAQLRRLAQYQRALTAEYGDAAHVELSDFYARDLAQICQDVNRITEDFLEETLQQSTSAWGWVPNLKVPRVSDYVKLPSLTLDKARRLLDTCISLFRTYVEYQKMHIMAAERDERRQRAKKRRKVNRASHRSWQCSYCTYMNTNSIRQTCEICLKDRSETDTEQRASEERAAAEEEAKVSRRLDTETLQKAVMGLAAVGTGVGAAQAMLAARKNAEKADEAMLCREGDESVMNGDFTNVAPMNTGRLVASDAEQIVNSVGATGVYVPEAIKNTSQQVFKLVSTMNTSLTDIEQYYTQERSRERKKGAIYLTSSLTCIISLLAKFSMPTQRGALLLVLAVSALAFPKRNTVEVEKARRSTLKLLEELAQIRAAAQTNKTHLRGMVSEALANHERRAREVKLEAAWADAPQALRSREFVSERQGGHRKSVKMPVSM